MITQAVLFVVGVVTYFTVCVAQAANAQVQFSVQAWSSNDCNNATAECTLQYSIQAMWQTEVLRRNSMDRRLNNTCLTPCAAHADMCRMQCEQLASTLEARSGACLCQRTSVDPRVLGLCRNDCALMNRQCATREFCRRDECPVLVDSFFDRSYPSTGTLQPICTDLNS